MIGLLIIDDTLLRMTLLLFCPDHSHLITFEKQSTLSLLTYTYLQVPDLDWVKVVQSSWKPCVIGGFILRFPWHTEEDVKESVEKFGAGAVSDFEQLLLEGGIAFGTGEHPTTQLCLEWITQVLKEDESVEMFLDYGAGSGVLGMAACKLNDRVEAVGVEIDLDAICGM